MSELIKIVGEVKDKFKIDPDKIFIEDPIFRLFSKITVSAFLVCGGLVTLSSLIGDKLECVQPPKEDVNPKAINQYCFIMSMYTVPHLYNKTVGVDVAHYGVGPHSPEFHEQRYHYYYQWVPIALFFQAMTFLVPHLLWKVYDAKKIKTICDLDVADKIKLKQRGLVDQEDTKQLAKKKESINKAAVFFVAHISYNKGYAIFYIFCEILNLALVLLNFWFTNAFLSNNFHNYGPRVVSFLNGDPDSELNPMNQVFPKVAKCDFHKYGPSGNIIRYDIMCVLALNIINEKIYLFLWFWFVILMIIGGLNLIYRAVLMFVPGLRTSILRQKVARQYQDSLSKVLQDTTYAEWFILNILSVNIDTLKFGELVDHIREALHKKTVNGRISSVSPAPSYTKNGSTSDDEPFLSKA